MSDPGDRSTESHVADQRVAELAITLRGCVNFFENLRMEGAGVPTAEAHARGAQAEPYGDAILSAFDSALSNVVVVEDLMRALAGLLGPPPDSPYALQVLLRSILEIGARAWHLLDPDADYATIAGRALNEWVHDAKRNLLLARTVNEAASAQVSEAAASEARQRIEKIFEESEAFGLLIVRSKSGKPEWIVERRLNATDLVNQAWARTHPQIGGFLYGLFLL